jgi:hypothetical protein
MGLSLSAQIFAPNSVMGHVRNMFLYQWGKKNLGPCLKTTFYNMYIVEENIIISPSFVNKYIVLK